MDTAPVSTFSLDNIDLHHPDAVRALIGAFAPQLAALEAGLDESHEPYDPHERLSGRFIGLIARHERYDPVHHPSVEAWFYRQIAAQMQAERPRRERRDFTLRLLAALARPPISLGSADLAAVLGWRENQILAHLRSTVASMDAPLSATDIKFDQLHEAVMRGLPAETITEPHREPRTTPLREAGWVAGGLLAILAFVVAFNRSSQADRGVDLFPQATAQLPAAIHADTQVLVHAPAPLQSNTNEPYYVSLQPEMTPDGRYLVFASNHPALVPGDTNGTFDVFLYDLQTGERSRVSTSEDGSQLQGDSTNPSISDDGRFIVFTYAGAEFGGGGVLLKDLSDGSVTVLDGYLPEGVSFFDGGSGDLAISGDGSIVAFVIDGRSMQVDSPAADEAEIHNDLIVYERASGSYTHVAVGNLAMNWALPLEISADGERMALMLLTSVEGSLDISSPNDYEAVILEWRSGQLISLNRGPDGNFGNGPSFQPAISGNGRYAVFQSTASDLVPGDTNDSTDVFLRNLETGAIERINLTQEGAQAEGGNPPDELGPRFGIWGDRFAISHEGDFVHFVSSAPNLIVRPDSTFCTQVFDAENTSICFSHMLYSRQRGEAVQLYVHPLLDQSLEGQFLLHPTISNSAELVAYTAGTWDFQDACPAEGCMSIRLLDRRTGEARILTNPFLEPVEPKPEDVWGYNGNVPAPVGWIRDVAVSPDGEWLIAAGQEGDVITADLETGERLLSRTGHTGAVNTIAISPDGAWFVSAGSDGTVIVWDAASGDRLHTLPDHPGIIFDIAISPDGERLAVGTQNELWIWTTTGDDFVRTSAFAQEMVTAVTFSPDGAWLVSSAGSEVWIRKVPEGDVVLRYDDHTARILDLAVTAQDGGAFLLASGSQDERAMLWEIRPAGDGLQAEYLLTFMHEDWVSAVEFSPDGSLFATGSFDSAIHLWSLPDGIRIQALTRGSQDQVLSLAFAPLGNRFISGSVRGIRVWSLGEGTTPLTRETTFFTVSNAAETVETLPYVANWFAAQGIQPAMYHDYRSFEEDSPGMTLRIPQYMPLDFTLHQIAVYQNATAETAGVAQVFVVTTDFQPATLTVLQTTEDLRLVDRQVGAGAEVIELAVAGYFAEAVTGGWSTGDPLNAGGLSRSWIPDAASLWLRWWDGEYYFSIFYDQPFSAAAIPNNELLTLEHLQTLAESLYEKP